MWNRLIRSGEQQSNLHCKARPQLCLRLSEKTINLIDGQLGSETLQVANIEKKMPRSYIDAEDSISRRRAEITSTLNKGEDFPKFQNGMPVYAKLRRQLVPKNLIKMVVGGWTA